MGNRVVVGIDPDSEKHGVAVYSNGVIHGLYSLCLPELMVMLKNGIVCGDEVSLSIENVMANQFVYARNQHSNKAAQSKIAMRIGRCQQAQVELMRWLDNYGIPYVLHKPQKGNWADKRELFERITGWNKQSNEDTRAAAYFGYLEASKHVHV